MQGTEAVHHYVQPPSPVGCSWAPLHRRLTSLPSGWQLYLLLLICTLSSVVTGVNHKREEIRGSTSPVSNELQALYVFKVAMPALKSFSCTSASLADWHTEAGMPRIYSTWRWFVSSCNIDSLYFLYWRAGVGWFELLWDRCTLLIFKQPIVYVIYRENTYIQMGMEGGSRCTYLCVCLQRLQRKGIKPEK